MKLIHQQIDSELKSKIAKPTKRFFVSIADSLILLIVAIISFSTIAINIMAEIPSFKENINKFNVASDTCLDIYYNSHLGAKNGDSNYSNDDLTYFIIKNYVSENYYDENSKLTDNILFFYSTYCVEANLTSNGNTIAKSISWVNTNIYKYINTSVTSFWKQDCDTSKPLILSNEAKSLLTDYINGVRNNEVEIYYKNFHTLFYEGLVNSQKELVNSDQYKSYVNICESIYPYILQYYTIAAIINFVVIYSIFFLLIPYFSIGGQTLMKRLFKIELYDESLIPISKRRLLIRNSIGFILYFFLVPLTAIPAITSAFLYLPLFIIDGTIIYLGYFVLASFAISLISIIYMFIDKKNRNLHDAISHTLALVSLQMQKDKIIEEDEYEKKIKKISSEGR